MVWTVCPLFPQTPRGGTWTSGIRWRMARAREAGSRSGHHSLSSSPSSLAARGRSSSSVRAAATSASMSTPSMPARLARLAYRPRSKTGCNRGRRARKSRAVTRCTVLRISAMRTARRSRIRQASSSERKPSSRVHRPKYGGLGAWACMPTRCSIASAADIFQRRNNNWRASVTRFSSRSDRVRSATASPHLSSPPSLLNGLGPDHAFLAPARSGRLFGLRERRGRTSRARA